MAQTILHMLGDLFGIKNFAPIAENKAHFSLERNTQNYILDAELLDDSLVLCLSRELLPHEESDEDLPQEAAHIAHEHEPTKAYYHNKIISFVRRIPQNSSMNILEKALDDCIKCQDTLRGV